MYNSGPFALTPCAYLTFLSSTVVWPAFARASLNVPAWRCDWETRGHVALSHLCASVTLRRSRHVCTNANHMHIVPVTTCAHAFSTKTTIFTLKPPSVGLKVFALRFSLVPCWASVVFIAFVILVQ
uniref:Secreted protein n=1 Tax=Mesocestoides corti TaxID=53468 RepID=A0A5K3ENP5_MESCO